MDISIRHKKVHCLKQKTSLIVPKTRFQTMKCQRPSERNVKLRSHC